MINVEIEDVILLHSLRWILVVVDHIVRIHIVPLRVLGHDLVQNVVLDLSKLLQSSCKAHATANLLIVK